MKYSPFYADTIGLCTEDGTVKIINLVNGEIVNSFAGFHLGTATGLDFSPVTEVFLCTCGADGKLNFFDLKAKKLVKTLMTNTQLTCVSFNLEGNHVICGDIQGNVIVYDLRNTDKPKAMLRGNKGQISHIEVRKAIQVKNPSKSLNNSIILTEPSKSLTNSGNSKNHSTYEIEAKRLPSTGMSSLSNHPISGLFQKPAKEMEKSSLIYGSNKMVVDERPQAQEGRNVNDIKEIPFLNGNNLELNNKMNMYQIDPRTQDFVRKCIENETEKLKEFVHEHINSLHLELIRQFQLNQAEMIQNIKPIIIMNNRLNQEIEKLKRENADMKAKYY